MLIVVNWGVETVRAYRTNTFAMDPLIVPMDLTKAGECPILISIKAFEYICFHFIRCDVDNDPNAAEPCDPSLCNLPECFCSKDGTLIPGRLESSQVPQMILLTFDDAINFENWDLYTTKIFTPNRKNPNGCPIKATFYVSHQYTNYAQVQKIWNDGHEVGIHSIT